METFERRREPLQEVEAVDDAQCEAIANPLPPRVLLGAPVTALPPAVAPILQPRHRFLPPVKEKTFP